MLKIGAAPADSDRIAVCPAVAGQGRRRRDRIVQTPETPFDETTRVATLRALNVLDTPAEERFDRLTRLAKRLFDVPIALVSLVDSDRQWFKSRVGLEACETSRDVSFCGHAILDNDVFVVNDAARDPRFNDNPLVDSEPRIRFYAGCPLTVGSGLRLGTLCLIDRTPREFGEEDKTLLRDLAVMAQQELEAVELATMDELTGVSNRRGFVMLAGQTLGMCMRLNKPAALVYLDLDDFKPINDRFGHAEGDRALRDFANLLLATFRDSDVVARLGGDEFAVLVGNADRGTIHSALDRLQQTVDGYNRQARRGYGLRYSVGMVTFDPTRHHDIDQLVADADASMYQNKRTKAGSAAIA